MATEATIAPIYYTLTNISKVSKNVFPQIFYRVLLRVNIYLPLFFFLECKQISLGMGEW